MAINKAHDEFHTLDMSKGWETPTGYPAGIQQKILAGALDEPHLETERHKDFDVAEGFKRPETQVDRDIRVDQWRFEDIEPPSPPTAPMESSVGESGRGPAWGLVGERLANRR